MGWQDAALRGPHREEEVEVSQPIEPRMGGAPPPLFSSILGRRVTTPWCHLQRDGHSCPYLLFPKSAVVCPQDQTISAFGVVHDLWD